MLFRLCLEGVYSVGNGLFGVQESGGSGPVVFVIPRLRLKLCDALVV